MRVLKDRKAAGKLLAKRLKGIKADIVLGIPRGGVVVANEIAKELKLPLDVLVIRKIGAPTQQELALGAVDPDGETVWDEDLIGELRMVRENLAEHTKEQWKEVKRREDMYRGGKGILDIQEKTVILVDDGIATGATTLSAIKYLKKHGAKIILAVPVASKDSVFRVVKEIGDVGKIEVLETPDYFQAVGQFYQDFPQVSDEEVVSLLS